MCIMSLHYGDRLHDNIARYLGNRLYCAVHLYEGDISNIPMGNMVMYNVQERYSNVATLIGSIYYVFWMLHIIVSLYLHR